MKRKCFCIVATVFFCMTATTSWAELSSVGIGYGKSFRGTGFEQYNLQFSMDQPSHKVFSNSWVLRSDLEVVLSILTWDGDSASALLYVDGQMVRPTIQGDIEEVPSIDGLSVGRHAGYLGGFVGATTNTFDGNVDEIRVWNRPISAAEVQASYQASSKASFAFPKPAKGQGNWKVLGANAANKQMRVEATK
jgi:hypothetical protein